MRHWQQRVMLKMRDDGMQQKIKAILDELIRDLPELSGCRTSIETGFEYLYQCYANGGKVMVCGNGGSAADAEHIVGELMKGFLLKRQLNLVDQKRLQDSIPQDYRYLISNLQGTLPAISLVSQTALISAFSNDVSPDMVYAQQVYGYGRCGDVLIALSTSGNSRNVINAIKVAKAFGVHIIGLTGQDGGMMKDVSDVTIKVPTNDTYKVQEYHLPVYHALCAMLEAEFFPE
jgi:D-sedoheptulose 7-phosphate isomerase